MEVQGAKFPELNVNVDKFKGKISMFGVITVQLFLWVIHAQANTNVVSYVCI